MDEGFNIRDFLDVNNMTEDEINRCEFWVTANRITRETGKYNFQEARIPVNCNWNLELMESKLLKYEDKKVLEFIKFGWPLNAKNTGINSTIPPNQKGVQEHPEQVRRYLKQELESGSVIGPFLKNPFGKFARFSPLDTRPKRDSDELRVILNLSFPFEGESVNQSINKDWFADEDSMELHYPTVDDLAKMIREKNDRFPHKKVLVWKRDLAKAYRQLWNCPSSVHLLGYSFDEKLFFDVCLSMGSKSAAYCCQRTTDCITYMHQQNGYDNLNYLDDLGAADEEETASNAFISMEKLLEEIGIKESKKKACIPAVICIFLGILFNTVTMTMEITPDRMEEIELLLDEWEVKEKCTLRELQSLLGKLNFAASTIRAGRVFISRIINMLRKFPKKGHCIVEEDLKSDVKWWRKFMRQYDGISILPPLRWDAPDRIFSTDATLKACGGWSEGLAFHVEFPAEILRESGGNINELELMAFVLAIRLFGERLCNRNILAYCDNKVSVDVVNSGAARNRFSQKCLRELCFLTAEKNAMVRLVHLNGSDNRISDCLSRWEKSESRKEFYRTTEGTDITFLNVTKEDFNFKHKW